MGDLVCYEILCHQTFETHFQVMLEIHENRYTSEMNEQQLLRDPDIEPTSEVIAGALGSANTAYIMFLEGLTGHDIGVEWHYYYDGKAWLGKGLHKWTGIRGGHKEVTAFWLSMWDGFFKITVFIPEKARAEALNLPLCDCVHNMISEAKQMGKLKFFPLTFDINSDELFDDIYALAIFRKMLK